MEVIFNTEVIFPTGKEIKDALDCFIICYNIISNIPRSFRTTGHEATQGSLSSFKRNIFL